MQTTGKEMALDAVSGNASSAAVGVPFGAELVRFAEAVARRDAGALESARRELLETAGAKVLVDAAGVAANFQRMVRIADATGIPVDQIDTDLSREIRSTLGLERFASAGNTPGALV
jgi:DNA-binding phage protein